jgi:antitoxin YqcF
LAAPGVVYPHLVSDYVPTTTVPHVMWAEPQVWREMSSVQMASFGEVHWLMAVPISGAERRYLAAEGYDALERRLQAAAAPFCDLMRSSTV